MAAPTYKDEILHVEGDQVVKRDEAGAMITHRVRPRPSSCAPVARRRCTTRGCRPRTRRCGAPLPPPRSARPRAPRSLWPSVRSSPSTTSATSRAPAAQPTTSTTTTSPSTTARARASRAHRAAAGTASPRTQRGHQCARSPPRARLLGRLAPLLALLIAVGLLVQPFRQLHRRAALVGPRLRLALRPPRPASLFRPRPRLDIDRNVYLDLDRRAQARAVAEVAPEASSQTRRRLPVRPVLPRRVARGARPPPPVRPVRLSFGLVPSPSSQACVRSARRRADPACVRADRSARTRPSCAPSPRITRRR